MKQISIGLTIAAIALSGSFVFAMEETMKKDDAMMKKDESAMMKKEEGAMMDKKMAPEVNLYHGTRGEAVVVLQRVLEEKGFLVMPVGVAKGYFGSLTKAAVMKYQAMLGVPQTGYYGAMTRAKHAMKGDMMKGDAMMKKEDGAMMKKDQ